MSSNKYQRTGSYRASFMRQWPPKHGYYRCVYCGKRLRPEQMEVDHIVPVGAVRHNILYRPLVSAEGVNSFRNLVPSCRKCNNRKGGKCGLWLIRGKYWKICLPLNIIIHLMMYAFVIYVIGVSVSQIQMDDLRNFGLCISDLCKYVFLNIT